MEFIEIAQIEYDLNQMVRKCPAPELMENGIDICTNCDSRKRCDEVN